MTPLKSEASLAGLAQVEATDQKENYLILKDLDGTQTNIERA